MGVVKVSYYTVQCNCCNDRMESYVGEQLEQKRANAEQIARDCGFVQVGKNTWICPECKKGMKK